MFLSTAPATSHDTYEHAPEVKPQDVPTKIPIAASGWHKVAASIRSLPELNSPLALQPGKVWRHESHFFYSFILTEKGAQDLRVPFMPTEKEYEQGRNKEWTKEQRRFGNADMHLTGAADLCFRTDRVEIDKNGLWGQRHSEVHFALAKRSYYLSSVYALCAGQYLTACSMCLRY